MTKTAILIIGGIGALLWTITYVLVVWKAHQDKVYGMPFAAMCANFSWETLELFVFHPARTIGEAERIETYAFDITWFGLDLLIIGAYFLYWRVDFPKHVPGVYRFPMVGYGVIQAAAIIVGLQIFFQNYDPNHVFGSQFGIALAAFAQNLMMSLLFVIMLVRRNSPKGQSVVIAACKGIGTFAASVSAYLIGATEPFWIALYVSIFTADFIYVVLLYQKIQREKNGH